MVSRDWIRKKIFNMTDDEIKEIEIGKIQDKKIDLEIEAVKLPPAEGEEEEGEDDGMEDSPADIGGEGEIGEEESPFTDLAGLETAGFDRGNGSETNGESIRTNKFNIKDFSIADSDAPIKAQNQLNILAEMLREDDEDEDDEDEDSDNSSGKTNNKKKGSVVPGKMDGRSEVVNPIDHSHGGIRSAGDSLSNPFGNKYDKKKLANPLKGESAGINNLLEDDAYVDNFIEESIESQAKMTSQIRSTLKSLRSQISNKQGILISEDLNSSGERNLKCPKDTIKREILE